MFVQILLLTQLLPTCTVLELPVIYSRQSCTFAIELLTLWILMAAKYPSYT